MQDTSVKVNCLPSTSCLVKTALIFVSLQDELQIFCFLPWLNDGIVSLQDKLRIFCFLWYFVRLFSALLNFIHPYKSVLMWVRRMSYESLIFACITVCYCESLLLFHKKCVAALYTPLKLRYCGSPGWVANLLFIPTKNTILWVQRMSCESFAFICESWGWAASL